MWPLKFGFIFLDFTKFREIISRNFWRVEKAGGPRVRGEKEGESYAIKAILMQAKGFD